MQLSHQPVKSSNLDPSDPHYVHEGVFEAPAQVAAKLILNTKVSRTLHQNEREKTGLERASKKRVRKKADLSLYLLMVPNLQSEVYWSVEVSK